MIRFLVGFDLYIRNASVHLRTSQIRRGQVVALAAQPLGNPHYHGQIPLQVGFGLFELIFGEVGIDIANSDGLRWFHSPGTLPQSWRIAKTGKFGTLVMSGQGGPVFPSLLFVQTAPPSAPCSSSMLSLNSWRNSSGLSLWVSLLNVSVQKRGACVCRVGCAG